MTVIVLCSVLLLFRPFLSSLLLAFTQFVPEPRILFTTIGAILLANLIQ
jgi:hypothetical protein